MKKSRKLQKFRYLDQKLDCVPAGERTDEGCNVELTELAPLVLSNGDPEIWRSLCFEAFSSRLKGDLTAILWRTINYLFSITTAPRLTVDHSYGYPDWLAQLRSKGKR